MDTFKFEKSSNIDFVEYDRDAKVLIIKFKAGGKYSYVDVPSDVYESFIHAESAGRFFFNSIRGRYQYSRIPN